METKRTIIERRESGHHLVQKHTERPPVNGLAVAVAVENLGGEVLGCAAESVRLLVALHVELAQAEVAERDVAGVVQQDVLGLEVPIDHVEFVQMLEG